MRKMFWALPIAILAAGCGNTMTADCDDANGIDVQIRYGDSSIEVSHKIHVKQDEAIIIKLHPQMNPPSGIDYKNMEIEIRGEKQKDKWLNKKAKSTDDKKKLRICVKEDQAAGEYKYIVIVPKVGEIDPRVVVEPK